MKDEQLEEPQFDYKVTYMISMSVYICEYYDIGKQIQNKNFVKIQAKCQIFKRFRDRIMYSRTSSEEISATSSNNKHKENCKLAETGNNVRYISVELGSSHVH